MFPYNPWRNWFPKEPRPTELDLDTLIALFWTVTALSFFACGVMASPVVALLTVVVVGRDRSAESLLILTLVWLLLVFHQWLTWRFVRKGFAHLRALRDARLAKPSA